MIHKANRFHVIKLISLDSVEFFPKPALRSLFPHHLYVLEHTADDLAAVHKVNTAHAHSRACHALLLLTNFTYSSYYNVRLLTTCILQFSQIRATELQLLSLLLGRVTHSVSSLLVPMEFSVRSVSRSVRPSVHYKRHTLQS